MSSKEKCIQDFSPCWGIIVGNYGGAMGGPLKNAYQVAQVGELCRTTTHLFDFTRELVVVVTSGGNQQESDREASPGNAQRHGKWDMNLKRPTASKKSDHFCLSNA